MYDVLICHVMYVCHVVVVWWCMVVCGVVVWWCGGVWYQYSSGGGVWGGVVRSAGYRHRSGCLYLVPVCYTFTQVLILCRYQYLGINHLQCNTGTGDVAQILSTEFDQSTSASN